MLDSNLKIPLAKILDLEVNIDVVDIGASPSKHNHYNGVH